jgi:hypothetical protein
MEKFSTKYKGDQKIILPLIERLHLIQLFITFMLIIRALFEFCYSQSTIEGIPLPSTAYKRIPANNNSFAEWLRNLPLCKSGSDVLNYRNGIFKAGTDTAVAFVVDMDIKGRRHEQCMDILVRLYAEYLWKENQIENLNLPLPGGHWLKWEDWSNGFRPVFKGIDVDMQKSSPSDTTHQAYQSYLNTIYSEAHTQQFYHAYQPLDKMAMQIGDIIIRRGTKGHAVMVVDLAKNERGELIALIGNGDTPACQFFLLNHKKNSPWIPLDFEMEFLDLPLKRKMGWDGLRRFELPYEK